GAVAHGGDDGEIFGAVRVDADVDADRPDRRFVAQAEARCDGTRAFDDAADRLDAADLAAPDDAAVDEHRGHEVPEVLAERQRHPVLDAPLEQRRAAERLRNERALTELRRIGITELDGFDRQRAGAAAGARRAPEQRRPVDRQDARTEL